MVIEVTSWFALSVMMAHSMGTNSTNLCNHPGHVVPAAVYFPQELSQEESGSEAARYIRVLLAWLWTATRRPNHDDW